MIRIILAALAFALSLTAQAQTSVTRNCVTASCTVAVDVAASATGCRLYDGVNMIGEALRNASSGTCQWPPRNFTAGVHVLTATAYNVDGESPPTPALTLTSVAPNPPPAPTNLRFL